MPEFSIGSSFQILPGSNTELSQFNTYNFREAIVQARCEAFPSADHKGRFKKVPMVQSLCQCDSGETETIEYKFLKCNGYKTFQDKSITTVVKDMAGQPELDYCN